MVKLKRKNPALWYVGSLVQQNFGEAFEGHGYALCNLQTPKQVECNFVDIPNDCGYFTLDVVDGVLPPNLPITPKTNVRLRIRNTSPAQLKRILATIRKEYKNSDVMVQKLDKVSVGDDSKLFGESLHQGDIRNVQYQNQLITDYLTHCGVDDTLMQTILQINAKLNQELPQGEVARNVVWKPKKFEFSNMFSYGENNVVNFSSLDGTCGLFAPNHAGKSAILDSLCFCLFDHSFRASKAEQVLNRKKDDFWCKFNFELGGIDYFIEKKAYKYKSGPLKGKLRVDIDFWCVNGEGETVSLNGEQRRDTDKIIQSYVGTFDDFILTALSLQQNNSNFIDKTQGERKELLANFLDLKIFDTLYDLANKETKTASVILEEYQKQDFETKLGDAERACELNEQKHTVAQQQLTAVEREMEELTNTLLELNKQLQPCKADGLSLSVLEGDLQASNTRQQQATTDLQKAIQQRDVCQQELQQVTDKLDAYKQSFDTTLHTQYIAAIKQKEELERSLNTYKITVKSKLEKLEKLEKHEYDPNCKYCVSNVFVQDAIATKGDLEKDKTAVQELLDQLKQISDFIVHNEDIQTQAESIQSLIVNRKELINQLDKHQSLCDRYEYAIDIEQHKIEKIKADIQTYRESLAVIEENKKIQAQIREVERAVSHKKIELSKLNNTVKDLHGKIKVAEQTISDCNAAIQHMQQLVEKQEAYDYYCRAVCKDGIPYVLISKAVPYIQQYVNNILSQVIDFTVELETDGKNINAFICYDDNKWALELSSGMERFISSLAIRIALIKITNLPKPDFIAIDEGLGVLDSSNLNSMHTLFTYMKDIFRFSLVISHIDVVRDMVDNIITIDRKDDFSHISC